jgi:hypothetical protein
MHSRACTHGIPLRTPSYDPRVVLPPILIEPDASFGARRRAWFHRDHVEGAEERSMRKLGSGVGRQSKRQIVMIVTGVASDWEYLTRTTTQSLKSAFSGGNHD